MVSLQIVCFFVGHMMLSHINIEMTDRRIGR